MFLIESICFVTMLFYLYMGAYSIQLNPKAAANRVYLVIVFIFAAWSGAAFYRNLVETSHSIILWRTISLLAWSIGSCVILHFVILLIRQRKHEKIVLKDSLIHIPGLLLFIIQFNYLYSNIVNEKNLENSIITTIGSPLFYLLYVFLSIILLYRWKKITTYKREKRQSVLIIFSLFATTISIFLYGSVLSSMADFVLPFLTPVFPVFWMSAMWIAITKHRLLKFRADIAVYEIMENVLEIILLTDPQGNIIEVNNRLEAMLGYKKVDLLGKSFFSITNDKNSIEHIKETKQFTGEFNLNTINNDSLPVRLLVSPVEDNEKEVVGYVYSAQDLTLEKQYQQLSYTDRLTQVCNRLKLDEVLEKEVSRSIRYGETFSILIMDIDHFKRVNDEFGHQIGDSVLISVSQGIKKTLRESDTFGRWGGEEFLAVFPNTPIDAAVDIAEKLRLLVNGISVNSQPKITSSFGVSVFNGKEDDVKGLVSRADMALYKAKTNGRNRVEKEL